MMIKDFVYTEDTLRMNYRIFEPEVIEDAPPLMIYLHGAGERGSDITHIHRHGIPKLIQEGRELPAIVLAPQCPAPYVWDNLVDKVKKIIDLVVQTYSVSKERITLTGSSMGGFGTWMMAKTYPSFFAGIAPVAGGGMSWRTSKLISTPVLAFHGTEDDVVPMIYSSMMVEGVLAAGGRAELVLIDGYGHNDGIDYAYRNTRLISWLTEQRRTNFEYVPEICESMF